VAWFGKPSQSKSVDGLFKVLWNLFEKTSEGKIPNLPTPGFQLPDSQFRYLMFSFITAYVACAPKFRNPDAVLNELMYRLVTAAIQLDSHRFFGGPVEGQDAANRAGKYVQDYMDQWSAQIDIRKAGNEPAATGIVAGMIHHTESELPFTKEDGERLFKLARWIVGSMTAMAGAFSDLT
jgi:hypothetical protein